MMDSGSKPVFRARHATKTHGSARASGRKSHSLIAISPGVRALSRGRKVTKTSFHCVSAVRSGAAPRNILSDRSAGQLFGGELVVFSREFCRSADYNSENPRNQNRVIGLDGCPWRSELSLVDYGFTVHSTRLVDAWSVQFRKTAQT